MTNEQKAEVKVLEGMPDAQTNTTTVPELLNWSDARHGAFYQPMKQQITLRLDAERSLACRNKLAAATR